MIKINIKKKSPPPYLHFDFLLNQIPNIPPCRSSEAQISIVTEIHVVS